MIDSGIRNLIFDFGGVLIHIDYQATVKAFENLGIDAQEAFYAQHTQSALFDAYETGKISSQHFINGLLDHLPSGTSPNKVVAAWNAMILDVPAYSIHLLQDLRARGYRLFMLSNTNALHIDLALRRWAHTSPHLPEALFDKVYLSHEMGMRKPDPAIFTRVCHEQGLNPAETLFIDDSIQHIVGAQSAGLHTYHLEGEHTLQALFS
jgi:putative hydrolase of the HAD superfamily